MAPQLIRSAVYCGVMVSRNSVPQGRPSSLISHRSLRRQAQALVDAEAAVHARIVDQALPAHGGARLLEIDPHQDQQVVGETRGLLLQAACILHRRFVIVDRAGTDHHHQPSVGTVQDPMQGLARLVGSLRRRIGGRKFAQDVAGGREFLDLADAYVVGDVLHDRPGCG
jgi:hypothetical protein